MKITALITTAIALLLPLCKLSAQVPYLLWQHCLGGILYEDSQGVVATPDGGCAVLGSVASMEGDVIGNHGPPDIWLVKLNATGQIQWQHCYGGTHSEEARRLLGTDDGGFVLTGFTLSTDGNVACTGFFRQAWALKVDSLGSIQWQACLPGDLDGSGGTINHAVATVDGGYIVVGSSNSKQTIWSENHGQMDFFAAKLNGDGEVQWLHCYGGSGMDEAWAIRATPEGNYVIAGTSGSTDGQVTTGSTGQVWVIKINPEGGLLWNRRMGGSGGPDMADQAKDLVVNPDGSMLVVASTASNDGDVSGNHGGYDAWLVMLDSEGTILQQRCIGGTENDLSWAGTASGPGRFVLAGTALSNDGDLNGANSTGWNVWALMVDANMNLLWQHCFGGGAVDEGYAVDRNAAGELFITGRTWSGDGDVIGNHFPGVPDIWAIKLASDLNVGMSEEQEQGLLLAYPSPVADQVNIVLPAQLKEQSVLDILDITGRVLFQAHLEHGIHTVPVQVAAWTKGVYCLRLRTGSGNFIGRFVKH